MKSPFRLLALVLTFSLAGMPQLAVAQTIEELFQQGNAAQEAENYSQAEAIYRRIIQLEPNNAKAYYKLCYVLDDQNKLDDAVAACRKSIALNSDAQTYSVLDYVLDRQGKLEEAIASYQQAIQLDPKSANAYSNLGVALKDQGKLEEAIIEEYKKALEIDPNYVYASNNLQEAERLLTLSRNPQAEVTDDDRQYLPKNEPSLPILRSVVLIKADFSSSERQGSEYGTGLVIQRDGNRTLIITNRHVIFDKDTKKQGQNIQIEFFSEPPSGKLRMRRNARVLGMTSADDKFDIAVLEVTGPLPDDIKPLPTSSNPIQRQMSVRAIGHPVRGIPWSIEPGTISSYNSQQLQISGTAIQPGNSGGPVINSENQLLGIVVEVDGGLGFAYPMPIIMEKLRGLGIK